MKLKLELNKIIITDVAASKVKNNELVVFKEDKIEIKLDTLKKGKNIFSFLDFNDKPIKVDLEEMFYFKNAGLEYYAYNTKNNNLVINVDDKISTNTSLKICGLGYSNEYLKVKYKVIQNNNWEKVTKLILRERKTSEEIEFEILANQGIIKIDNFPVSGIYDFLCEVQISEDIKVVKKLGKYRYSKELLLKNSLIKNEHDSFYIAPYTTYKASKLTLKVDVIKTEYLNALKAKVSDQNVWLIGEQPEKAQDNGYFLFKYLRENHPEVEAYYVIDYNSKDFEKVKQLGNTINFGSKEHFKIIPRIKYLISTHHPDYLLPLSDVSILNSKIYKIFLQHGVMGTKYMANFYGKYSNNPFEVDKVCVSSEREKNMLIKDFEYDAKDIMVTGLARFDNLLKKSSEPQIDILIIPTWRDWLSNEPNFAQSEYFKRYLSLTKQLSDKYKIKFILHINMAQYKSVFTDFGIEAEVASEVNVQDLLKDSKFLITDYSSVSFDFSFLDRPVIYYQFDQKSFFGKNGSHFDIYKELPGIIVSTEGDVLEEVNRVASNNFIQSSDLNKKSSRLIEYRDEKTCERIYEEIKNCNKKASRKFFKKKIFKKAFNFYRRSKLYYPLMKLMYNTFKFLPKKDYIFLECSNGKSFSDSPKEIYLEWSKRDPKQQFIVAYNGVLPHKYKNIKAIKRLSPQYFYVLSRANTWISNQNLPYYIKNHRTNYIQTWHGTPLKKMLYDITHIKGRDEGYIDRVTKAKNQWSYLISPSKYATKCFQSAFDYSGEILEVGYPRNDLFFVDNKSLKKELNSKYGINNKKVILFAPTFRDYGKKVKNKYYQDLKLDFEKLYQELHEEYIFIIKLHPLSLGMHMPQDKEDFYKISPVDEDINDLLQVTDILITDYSSVMFDNLLTKNKTIIYAWDYKQYSQDRGFYLDFENEVPGQIVYTEEDLISEIQNPNIEYDINRFLEIYCGSENGTASRQIVDMFIEDESRKNEK